MTSINKLPYKHALIKVVGVAHHRSVDVAFGDHGVWVMDKPLISDVIALAKVEGLPIFLEKTPALFLPFSQLEWVMTSWTEDIG